MRILFLLPDLPYPPSSGGKWKIFNELMYLSRDHQCDILCFAASADGARSEGNSPFPRVRLLGVYSLPHGVGKWMRMLWNLVRGLPPSLAGYYSREFAAAAEVAIRDGDYDVIHYDIVNMAQYLPRASATASVHSPNDATSLSYFRMARQQRFLAAKARLALSGCLLKRYERRIYPLFTVVHVVSPVDAGYLTRLNPTINIDTIPISIDAAFLIASPMLSWQEPQSCSPRIVCTGNFANPGIAKGIAEFLATAYPKILKAIPNVQFAVLGQNVTPELRDRFKSCLGIEFLSWVDDYRGFLVGADVVLAPDLAGTGIKTRVVQAMGVGRPVVGTVVAFEGIPIVDGTHGIVYRAGSDCADSIIGLLTNKESRERIGAEAHRLAAAEYSLDALGPRYEGMYRAATRKFRSIGPHR